MNSACAQHFTAEMWKRTAREPRSPVTSAENCQGSDISEAVPCVGTGMLASLESSSDWMEGNVG